MSSLDFLLWFAVKLESASETSESDVNNHNSNDDNKSRAPDSGHTTEPLAFDTTSAPAGVYHLTYSNNNNEPDYTSQYPTATQIPLPQQQSIPTFTMCDAHPHDDPQNAYETPFHTPNYYDTDFPHTFHQHPSRCPELSLHYDSTYDALPQQPCYCGCYGDERIMTPVDMLPQAFYETAPHTLDDTHQHDTVSMFPGQEMGGDGSGGSGGQTLREEDMCEAEHTFFNEGTMYEIPTEPWNTEYIRWVMKGEKFVDRHPIPDKLLD